MSRLREALADAVSIDHELAQIERELQVLVHLTPVNAAEAWVDFERSGFNTEPTLQSRPLSFDPDVMRRRLYELRVEGIGDPGLGGLLASKRDELARSITLLTDRDTSRFVYGSLQIFGDVADALEAEARAILEAIPARGTGDRLVAAAAFAEAAQSELDRYRAEYDGFDLVLEIRPDVSDLMVSHGRLLIPAEANFRSRRVEALIQHEVGTHMLTYANGNAQPLKMFAVGLPGYEETQEGLALLAEYLIGGLDPLRLRLIAARVIAVNRMIQGAQFLEIFGELHEEMEFGPRTAWGIAIRVTRCGGLTKDAIYLRGIGRLLEFAKERKNLEPLLVGKLSLDHVALVEDLLEEKALRPAWLRPHWLESVDSHERLQRVYDGITATGLIDSEVAS